MTAKAFDGLARLAATGTDYTKAMTYRHLADQSPENLAQVVARGHMFTQAVEVPDQDTDNSVTGNASVRVLHTTSGTLLLCARVEWRTSSGVAHAAQAAYAIESRAAAQNLADTMSTVVATPVGEDPTPEERESIARAADTDLATSLSIDASWGHEYPGAFNSESDFDAYAELDQAGKAVVEAAAEYHEHAVLALMEAHPQMLCMLSDSALGSVHPDELEKILAWATSQPAPA